MDTTTLNLFMPIILFVGIALIMIVGTLLMRHERNRSHR